MCGRAQEDQVNPISLWRWGEDPGPRVSGRLWTSGYLSGKSPGLIQLVLTVLVLWSGAGGLPGSWLHLGATDYTPTSTWLGSAAPSSPTTCANPGCKTQGLQPKERVRARTHT